MQLTILHTNDLHGHVERLAYLSSMARRIRAEAEAAGGAVLLLDVGDAEEKSLLESDVTKGAAVMALLSAAGYHAMAVGNGAPLSYGPQCLPDMAAAASFPLLAANFTWAESGKIVEGVTPAVLLVAGGVNVGLIGLAPLFDFWSLFGVDVPQGIEAVRHWRDELRAQGATIIVVLSHQGSRSDRKLAQAVDGLDVIIGGHLHEELPEGLWEGETLICQAGDYGRFLGRVDLTVDDVTGRVTEKQALLLPLDESLGPDPAAALEWQRQQMLVAEMLDQPIGETIAPLPHDPLRESPMGNFLADVLRERMDSQVALCISGSLHEGLPGGTVTLGDMCNACSSPGNPGRTILTGAQLREMLSLGLDPERSSQRPHFLRGRPLGILAVSGMRVEVDHAAPDGQRIRRVWVGKELLRDDECYTIAATDFEMDGMTYRGLEDRIPGVSFTIPPEAVEYELPTVLREAMEDYLRRHSPAPVPDLGRLTVSGKVEEAEGNKEDRQNA
jgi:2',3'-cyclic-nucleotide 2'-phosphodiesterase (5'-nucleotidase family)